MIESLYQIPLKRKRDLRKMESGGQRSKIQLAIENEFRKQGFETTPEVMIYNEKYESYPFMIDIVLPDFDLAIEIDGIAYHNNPKSKEREERKNKAIKDTGYSRTLRVPIETPEHLLYNPNEDEKLGTLKWKGRELWRKNKAVEVVIFVIENYNEVSKLVSSRLLQ